MGYIDLKRKNFQTVNKVEKNFYHTRTLVNKTKLKKPTEFTLSYYYFPMEKDLNYYSNKLKILDQRKKICTKFCLNRPSGSNFFF